MKKQRKGNFPCLLLAAKSPKDGRGEEVKVCILDEKTLQGAFLNSALFANCDVNIIVLSG